VAPAELRVFAGVRQVHSWLIAAAVLSYFARKPRLYAYGTPVIATQN